jgi:hypothetical protein
MSRPKRTACRRATGLVAVCLGVLALAAEPSVAQESDLDVAFAPGRPATLATLKLHIVYRDPADPDGKPSPIWRIVIVVPRGTTFNVGTVPSCQASNQEIQLQGPGACPSESQIGVGTLTAITGFGPPIDPFTGSVTIFNDGHGWIEVVQDRQSGATIAVDRFEIQGNTLTGHPPATPGGPPDGQTAVRTIDFTFPAARGFVTTPPKCPRGRAWTSTAAFTFADGSTQHVESQARCQSGSDGGPGLPRMQLRVTPRRVETGWRRIRFHVGSTAAQCQRGATVHLARHHARTDADGRASIRVHLTRPGTYRASVTKPGCRRAEAKLVATDDDDG